MKEFFITAGELAEYINCKILGDKGKKIYGIALMQDSTENTLTYVMSDKRDRIQDCNAGVILTTASIGLPLYRTYIFTNQEPYYLLNEVICYMINKGLYCNNENYKPIIADSAVISQNVAIGNGSVIGENCFIGANTVIGDNTIIEDNADDTLRNLFLLLLFLFCYFNTGYYTFDFRESAFIYILSRLQLTS